MSSRDKFCEPPTLPVAVASRRGGLDHAAHLLSAMCTQDSLPLDEQLQRTSSAFTSGASLVALSQQLEKIARCEEPAQHCDDTRAELALRSHLIAALRCPESRPNLEELGRQSPHLKNERFAYWLTQLQTFWFAGNYKAAEEAVRHTALLLTPLAPLPDVLCCHLFSVLTLGRSTASYAASAIGKHCLELNRLARAGSVTVAVIAELAAAVRDRCAGKTLVALSGLERANEHAAPLGLHWVAAIVSEEAALAASQAGLHSAVDHYRRDAFDRYRQWGALGRVGRLESEWGCATHAGDDDVQAENGRMGHIGGASDIELSIAHEINQPLAVIALHSAAARKWLCRAEPNVERALESLTSIGEAGRHAGEIVRVIKRIASHEDNEFKCVSVDDAINDVLRLLQSYFRKHGITAERDLDARCATIQANRIQLQQVLTNLLVNAIEALAATRRSSGPRHIRVASRTLNEQQVEVTVEDNGPGIEPADRDRIFDRLFTTKAGNTGLGLALSLAIVRAHHGSIEYEPREPHGARFRLRFPMHLAR